MNTEHRNTLVAKWLNSWICDEKIYKENNNKTR